MIDREIPYTLFIKQKNEDKVTDDENGNIISDENNSYTYDDLGELISTSGLVNASYQYDSREIHPKKHCRSNRKSRK